MLKQSHQKVIEQLKGKYVEVCQQEVEAREKLIIRQHQNKNQLLHECLLRYFVKIWRLTSLLMKNYEKPPEKSVANVLMNIKDMLVMKRKLKEQVQQNGELEKKLIEVMYGKEEKEKENT